MTTTQGWGLALQLGGLLVAAGALVWELLAARNTPTRPDLGNVERLLRERNPWDQTWAHEMSNLRASQPRGRTAAGSYADQTRFASLVSTILQDDRKRAKAAWDRQTKLAAQLYRSNQDLLERYLADIAGVHAATRRRVVVEMLGLVVASIGTVLSSLS